MALSQTNLTPQEKALNSKMSPTNLFSLTTPSFQTGGGLFQNTQLKDLQLTGSQPTVQLAGMNTGNNTAATTPATLPKPVSQQTSPTKALIPNQGAYPYSTPTPVPAPAPTVNSTTTKTTPSYQSVTNTTSSPSGTQSSGSQTIPQAQTGGLLPSFGKMVGGLYNTAQQNPGTSGPAFDKYQQAVEANRKLKSDIAEQYGLIEQTPIPLEFQQGREQVLARQYASQLDASQQAVNEQQAALGYQVQGQGVQQQGMGAAAGFAQPQFGQPGQYGYNPLNPEASNAALGPMIDTYARMAASGQIQGIPSQFTSNPAVWAQIVQKAQAMNPSFNYNSAVGQGSATQVNSQLQGTAGPAAYNQILGPSLQKFQQLQNNTLPNIDQFGSLLLQTMQQGGINPTDIRFANTTIAAIRNQLSDPYQAQFDNTLASLRSFVSGLLQSNGSEIPTAITADAQKIIDGTLPIGAMQSVMQRIQQEGNILLQNQANLVNQANQGIQGQTNQNTSIWDW